MNIVFWLLIAVAVFLIWIMLSPIFKHIGEIVINTKENIEDDMSDEDEEDY